MINDDEHVDLMEVIRRAGPDDLGSARTPAAQALLEEILSMHVTPIVEVADTPPVGDTPPAVVRRPGGRPLLFAGAAAAAAALAVGFLVVGSDEPSSADTVDAALTRSSSLLDRSGRAEITRRTDGDGAPDEAYVASWEFSGDDSSNTLHDIGDPATCVDGEPSDCAVNRFVDGEVYIYVPGPDGTYEWHHVTTADQIGMQGFGLDPTTLVDELDPAGGFDEVGVEQVEGVETTRYRAADPERTPLPDIDGIDGDTLTSLEVWIDHDGLLRRLDLVTANRHPEPPEPESECPDCYDGVLRSYSMSVVFHDLGAPITIEAPTEFSDIAPVG